MRQQRAPVDACLEPGIQFHLDDLGFEDHLAGDGRLGLLQVGRHIAQLRWHAAHHDDARLAVHHHVGGFSADQQLDVRFDALPEVRVVGRQH
ncbi:MAG: hypothetical protein IPH71_11820 [Proteobacteria bacterium]|nr:hypothetical protein [Pseudomonadota bacterium]